MSFAGSFLKIVSTGLFLASIPATGGLSTGLVIGALVAGTLGSLIDKPKLPEQRQQIGMSVDPNAPLPVVYGRAKVGSIVADWFIDPDTDAKILYQVVALCHGSRTQSNGYSPRIAKIEEIWIDGRRAIVNPTVGNAAESGGNDVREHPYALSVLDFRLFGGDSTQNIGNQDLSGLFSAAGTKSPSDVTDSGWSASTDTGKGIAAISLRCANLLVYAVAGGGKDKAKQPAYGGPPAITAIVRGNFVEDPRSSVSGVNITFTNVGTADTITRASGSFVTDGWFAGDLIVVSGSVSNNGTFSISNVAATVLTLSSVDSLTNEGPVGGVTLERWAHPTTGGGNNPALCVRDYLLATTYGWGLPASMIDEPTFATWADYCDELIDYPLTAGDDNTTRMTCNGVLDTSKTLRANTEELLSSGRGALDWSGGKVRAICRSEEAPAATLALTPLNIIGQWSFRNAGNAERWNLVTASYIDPLNGEFKAAQTQWPPIGSNSYLSADNDFLNRLDLSLPFTNDQAMAQMIAQITLNEARNGISCRVLCTEAALTAVVGDLVTVTHDTPGWDVKPFWVTAVELFPDTTVGLTLQEYEPDAYDLDTMEDRRTYAATSHVPADSEDFLEDDGNGPYDIVVNGNFRALLNDWNPQNATVIADTGVDRYTGVASAKMTLTAAFPYVGIVNAHGYNGSWRLMRVQPGETLRLSAAMKFSASLGATTVVAIFEYDADSVFITAQTGPSWVTETSWTVKSANVTVGAGTYYVLVTINQTANASGAGSVWVDEVHAFRTTAP